MPLAALDELRQLLSLPLARQYVECIGLRQLIHVPIKATCQDDPMTFLMESDGKVADFGADKRIELPRK